MHDNKVCQLVSKVHALGMVSAVILRVDRFSSNARNPAAAPVVGKSKLILQPSLITVSDRCLPDAVNQTFLCFSCRGVYLELLSQPVSLQRSTTYSFLRDVHTSFSSITSHHYSMADGVQYWLLSIVSSKACYCSFVLLHC
jgi:hypothetical protein